MKDNCNMCYHQTNYRTLQQSIWGKNMACYWFKSWKRVIYWNNTSNFPFKHKCVLTSTAQCESMLWRQTLQTASLLKKPNWITEWDLLSMQIGSRGPGMELWILWTMGGKGPGCQYWMYVHCSYVHWYVRSVKTKASLSCHVEYKTGWSWMLVSDDCHILLQVVK